jgi:hypothetical protein
MTAQERDFEDVLSHALHSATDQIEPVGDGLAKIRARLADPWLKRQWWLLRSEFMVLGWLVVVRCESFAATIRAGSLAADNALFAGAAEAGNHAAAGAGFGGRLRRLVPALGGMRGWLRLAPALGGIGRRAPAVSGWLRRLPPALSERGLGPALGGIAAWLPAKGHGGPRRSPGPVMNWLRPALAVAGAVVLVVVGVFALGQIREGIAGLTNGGGFTSGSSGKSTGNGVTTGQSPAPVTGVAVPPPWHGSGSARPATSPSSATQPSPSPCPSPVTSPGGSPSPSPSSPSPSPSSPSPSPSLSPSPTPSATPTPTVSPTTSTSAPLSAHRAAKYRTTALVTCGQPGPASSPTDQSSPT